METLTYNTTVQLPVEKINLYEWITTVSDKEYQSFSKGHKAMGLFKDKNTEGIVNIESIGGNLLINHYNILTKDSDHVVMQSEKSDAYLSHIIHFHVWVEWKMKVVFKNNNSSTFTCEVSTDYSNKFLAVAAKLSVANYFLQKHINEEGENFARSIELRFNESQQMAV